MTRGIAALAREAVGARAAVRARAVAAHPAGRALAAAGARTDRRAATGAQIAALTAETIGVRAAAGSARAPLAALPRAAVGVGATGGGDAAAATALLSRAALGVERAGAAGAARVRRGVAALAAQALGVGAALPADAGAADVPCRALGARRAGAALRAALMGHEIAAGPRDAVAIGAAGSRHARAAAAHVTSAAVVVPGASARVPRAAVRGQVAALAPQAVTAGAAAPGDALRARWPTVGGAAAVETRPRRLTASDEQQNRGHDDHGARTGDVWRRIASHLGSESPVARAREHGQDHRPLRLPIHSTSPRRSLRGSRMLMLIQKAPADHRTRTRSPTEFLKTSKLMSQGAQRFRTLY